MSPAISVLLPVRDAEATLPACLRSIARQGERDFECVIVDDGSRDRSREIAAGMAARDPRFRVLAPEAEGRGIVAALNAGLAECRGALVARMDADDLMHRERLTCQRRALDADPGLAAVGCHARLFPRAGLSDGMRAYEAWLRSLRSEHDVARDLYVECPLAHPTWLVRREAFAKLPYREQGWPEDYDWLLRAAGAGLRLGIVPRRLLAWRTGHARLSRTDPAYSIERFTACKAHFLARGFLAETGHYILWGYGHTGRALRRALASEGREPTHIVELHPGRLGNRIHGAPVVPPDALVALPRRPILVSVAGAAPRAEIRAALAAMGFHEREHFVCAA